LGENVEDYERFNLALQKDEIDEREMSRASGENTPAAVARSHRERVPTSGSARQQPQSSSQGMMQEGLQQREEAYARHHDDGRHNGNGDASSWDIDQQVQGHHSMAADGSSGHFLSNSLSPPPFSSSALGPLATPATAAMQDRSRTSEANGSRRRATSRPAFAQINSTSMSNEDGSSATDADGDADADVDADAEEGIYETKADGNLGFRSSIGTINGFSSKVPTQSQTKVRFSKSCMRAFLRLTLLRPRLDRKSIDSHAIVCLLG
jgi:hypothetical protein